MIQAKALVAAGLAVTLATSVAARAEDAAAPGGAGIVNGIPTNLQPTTGALLFVGPDLKNQFLDCSGVLIGCRTVLTAAHCICKNTDNYSDCVNDELPDIDVADLRFYFQHSGFHHVRDIYINPSYNRGIQGDLAVLRLSELVTGIEPARWHGGFPTVIPHGSDGIVAGFGQSGDDKVDQGIKRVGEIVTDACPLGTGVTEPANICWNFTAPILKPGDEANLCLKDDGGPLFLDFGNGPEVAGIHAGGGATCDEDSFSYDTNVVRSREWIKEVGGPDITRDQCSDYAEVGETWVQVQGGAGRLPRSEDEKRFAFDIPPDTILLRVTVNGDTERTGDYDMFVGLDQKIPTKQVFDCKQRGTGQFGACEFLEPDAQRVNVLIRHVRPNIGKGKSRFQVTVTSWQEKPPEAEPPRGPDMLRYTKRDVGLRQMTWIDDSDDEKGFDLQRRPGVDPTESFVTRATIGANKESILENVADDKVFTYRIRAFNDWGPSEWSNLCVVNKPRTPRPSRLRALGVTADQVSLRWRDNSGDESGMEVQRRRAGNPNFRSLKVLSPNDVNFVDKGVESGETYEYRIRAQAYPDECMPHSRYSNVIQVTVP